MLSNINSFLSRFPLASRWLIFLSYLAVIVYASLANPRKMPKLMYVPFLDKIVHFIMYFGFCIIALWALNTGNRTYKGEKGGVRNYLIVLVMAIVWGFTMELMQRITAVGRHYSGYDLLANIAGALFGALLFYFAFRNSSTQS